VNRRGEVREWPSAPAHQGALPTPGFPSPSTCPYHALASQNAHVSHVFHNPYYYVVRESLKPEVAKEDKS
jgi:hypothetical protein